VQEAEIQERWRELFYKTRPNDESLAEGERLIDELRPESPLRNKLGNELRDLREIVHPTVKRRSKPARNSTPTVPSRVTKTHAARSAAAESASPAATNGQAVSSNGHLAAATPATVQAPTPSSQPDPPSAATSSPAPTKLSKEELLAQVAAGKLAIEEAMQLLAALDAAKDRSMRCKVSEKGAISVYGLQRMPVTLYVEQWERLLNFADDIRSFARLHNDELKRKGT